MPGFTKSDFAKLPTNHQARVVGAKSERSRQSMLCQLG